MIYSEILFFDWSEEQLFHLIYHNRVSLQELSKSIVEN